MKTRFLNPKWNSNQIDTSQLYDFGVKTEKQKDEMIYTPKQSANAAFYLIEGYVRLVNDQTGITKVIGSGEFFGDRSIFYSNHIYAEALTPISYIQVDEPNFKQLMKRNASLALEVTTSISKHDIYLKKGKNIITKIMEIFQHLQRGHSIKLLWMNWKKEKSACLN